MFDACHILGDIDGGQSSAIQECIESNACHALRDNDGSQARTICERIISDACHSLGDCDGCQVAVTLFAVFFTEGTATDGSRACFYFKNVPLWHVAFVTVKQFP